MLGGPLQHEGLAELDGVLREEDQQDALQLALQLVQALPLPHLLRGQRDLSAELRLRFEDFTEPRSRKLKLQLTAPRRPFIVVLRCRRLPIPNFRGESWKYF